jgi:sugar lactone lactonase YvrE
MVALPTRPRWLRPKRWRPPPAPDRARRDRSEVPLPPLTLVRLPGRAGPEDVRFDSAGRVLAGLADGAIVRVAPESLAVEVVADTHGRPLGLAVLPGDEELLVCDALRGLLRVPLDGGAVEVLVGEVAGEPVNFASNVVVAPDETIFFTTSTRRFGIDHWRGDILENSSTGRLLRRDPAGTVTTLLDGLQFANGVVLAPDGSHLVFAESGGYRLSRYWLAGPRAGRREPFAENLPGFPDNISLGSDGLIWVSLASPRNPLLDRVLPLPGLVRQLVWLLPERMQPDPAHTCWVVAYDVDGRLVHDLQAPDAGYVFVTSVAERYGRLALGSISAPSLALATVPT